jgi:hypothetical protein
MESGRFTMLLSNEFPGAQQSTRAADAVPTKSAAIRCLPTA